MPRTWSLSAKLGAIGSALLLMALASIGAHKLRSSLTLLGVLVGVFSIVLVMTVWVPLRLLKIL